jgi:hypothetical protein
MASMPISMIAASSPSESPLDAPDFGGGAPWIVLICSTSASRPDPSRSLRMDTASPASTARSSGGTVAASTAGRSKNTGMIGFPKSSSSRRTQSRSSRSRTSRGPVSQRGPMKATISALPASSRSSLRPGVAARTEDEAVEEHRLGTELAAEPGRQQRHAEGLVIPPVADEDRARRHDHHPRPACRVGAALSPR